MAIEEGYTRFACDRAEKAHKNGKKPEAYLSEYDKECDDWHTVEWVDAHNIKMHYTLCPECWPKYQATLKKFQKDVQDIMNEGLY